MGETTQKISAVSQMGRPPGGAVGWSCLNFMFFLLIVTSVSEAELLDTCASEVCGVGHGWLHPPGGLLPGGSPRHWAGSLTVPEAPGACPHQGLRGYGSEDWGGGGGRKYDLPGPPARPVPSLSCSFLCIFIQFHVSVSPPGRLLGDGLCQIT